MHNSDLQDIVMVKIDYQNAFNSIRRDHILTTTQRFMPELYLYVKSCYQDTSKLIYNDSIIDSAEGTQQGDTLASLLFSLGIRKIISQLKAKLNKWYLDDGTVGDKWRIVLNDLIALRTASEEISLQFEVSKCELIILDQQQKDTIVNSFQAHFPNIKIIHPENAELLGTSLGENAFEDIIKKKHDKLITLCETLSTLDNHVALFLLQNCLGIPKLQHILRSTPCFQQPALHAIDLTLKEAVESILNVTLTNESWTQSALPIKLGGLGIHRTADVALPAFIALTKSFIANGGNTDGATGTLLSRAIEAVTIISGKSCPDTTKQGTIDEILCLNTRCRLLENADENLVKRVNGASCYGAGDWLRALPSAPLGLKLTNNQLRVAAAIRIGAPISQRHTCVCGTTVDQYAIHALHCTKSSGRHSRHSSCNNILKQAFSTSNIPSVLEPQNLYRIDGRRPDGLTLVPWERGTSLIWDFTCIDRLSPSYTNDALYAGPKVAEKAEDRKRATYNTLQRDYIFEPVAVETLGEYGPSTTVFLKKLSKRLRVATLEERAGAFFSTAFRHRCPSGECRVYPF